MSPWHLMVILSSSLASDYVNRKRALELHPVHTNAEARSILDRVLDGADILRTLDMIEELQNSPKLKSLALHYVEAAANVYRFKGMGDVIYESFCSSQGYLRTMHMIELNMDRCKELTYATGKLLAVMAELGKEESDLDGRLKSLKQWRKLWVPGYTAVMIAPLVVSAVLALKEMPQKVINSTSAVAGFFAALKHWPDSHWDERAKELEGTREVAKTMRRFAFQVKDELQHVQTLVEKLCGDLGTMRGQMHVFRGELEVVKEKRMPGMEKAISSSSEMAGKVNACAAGVHEAAVEFIKYIARG